MLASKIVRTYNTVLKFMEMDLWGCGFGDSTDGNGSVRKLKLLNAPLTIFSSWLLITVWAFVEGFPLNCERTELAFPSLWLVCREEQDCEYARVIQEELRRCDEEAQKREKEDEVLFIWLCVKTKKTRSVCFVVALNAWSHPALTVQQPRVSHF